MPLDLTRIDEKISSGTPYLEVLDELLDKSEDEFLNSLQLKLQAERLFEILAQIMLDVCTSIIANSSLPPPVSYADCMQKLGVLGVISAKKAEEFASLIRMRNLIAHQYGLIDHRILFRNLATLKDDFLDFGYRVRSWGEEKKGNVREL
ncbi:MAG: type VII toxin-antitoxin system HepT family RNase toxin [Promethearchaeota archaeon]